MSAQINGSPWVATCVSGGALPGNLAMAGNDAKRGITIEVFTGGPTDRQGSVPLAVGTYQIGGQRSWYGADSYIIWGNVCNASGCPEWQAQPQSGTGTVTITTLTKTSAAGTFSATLVPEAISGATGSVVMTDGVFSITF
jgi:hypothetical protein